MAKLYPEIEEKTDEVIKNTFTNIYSSSSLYAVKQLRDDILEIASNTPTSDVPMWFTNSLDHISSIFLDLFPGRNAPAQNVEVSEIYDGLMVEIPSQYNGQGRFRSIPFLKTFADVQSLKKLHAYTQNIDDAIRLAIQDSLSINEARAQIKTITEEGKVLNEQTKASLSALNKEVGKIGVKLYADIFDRQALEHSNFFKSKGIEDDKALPRGFGKAQSWALLAVLFILGIIRLFAGLDNYFPLTQSKGYTPEITAHLIGRIVTISLGVFLISFALKQFRVNMHLYTLNKHRANTLKSFEYLTKAPDKLDPSSYNAILMKVAESIYDAGQTGYIATSETNNDMPSIIDMSKIINPSK